MTRPPPISSRSHLTRVDGIDIHSEMLGGNADDDPCFVLVHGLGMSSRYMMPTARLLAAHGRVEVPDLPGFGKSGKPPVALDIPGLADALAAWIRARRLCACTLVGNSLGAQVIVDLAVRHPELLACAVLVGPTIDPGARRVSTQICRLLADVPREPLPLYPIGLSDYLRAGFLRVLRTLRHALRDPIVEKLPRVTMPVLVIRGGLDPLVPQRWVEQVERLIPRARQITFPGVAHAVNFDAPEKLAAEIFRFIASLPADGRVEPRL